MTIADATSPERGPTGGPRERGYEARQHPPTRMLAAAGIVTAVFVLSNAPTPLYIRWQSQLDFSSSTLTALFSVYIVGLLVTLAIAGQCADRFGCRAVLVPGIAAGMVACVLFASAESVHALLLARLSRASPSPVPSRLGWHP